MPIAKSSLTVLSKCMRSVPIAQQVETILNNGSGTLTDNAKARIISGIANRKAATELIAAIEAGSTLNGRQFKYLRTWLANTAAARDIANQMAT